MDTDGRPSDRDIVEVLEAHDILPDDRMLDEVRGLISLYADLIQKRLSEIPVSVNRQKAMLAILEEGLMQEGIIPNNHEKQFEVPGLRLFPA
ncbi:MAG: hypothetical protein ACOYW7_04950 [Nitrospirota bacterium]